MQRGKKRSSFVKVGWVFEIDTVEIFAHLAVHDEIFARSDLNTKFSVNKEPPSRNGAFKR